MKTYKPDTGIQTYVLKGKHVLHEGCVFPYMRGRSKILFQIRFISQIILTFRITGFELMGNNSPSCFYLPVIVYENVEITV